MTQKEYIVKVWPFYMRLEKDFIEALNYVEFSEDNYATYSVEFERLLLSICSEIDVLCKLLCREIDPAQSPSKFFDYAAILCGFNDFTSSKVYFEKTGIEVTPFFTMTPQNSPSWWQAYNKVKHTRTENKNYKKGNLENVFMSLSALYILNRFYCKMISTSRLNNEPNPRSQIFNMVGWQINIPVGNGFFQVLYPNGSMGLIHE